MNSIVENGEKWDNETLSCAKGFCQTIQDFDFNFFLLMFRNILPQATITFNIIQTKIFDVTYCNNVILDFLNYLKNMKNDFEHIWLKLEQYYTETPPSSKKQKLSIDKKTNYCKLYIEIIDVFISKTNERYSKITHLIFFSLLDFSKFEQYINQFPTKAMNSLKDKYSEHFDFALLQSELSIIYSSKEFHKANIHELWVYLKSTDLSDCLSQVTKLTSLIVTIPATSSGTKCSFSYLKRIKTHLQNSQSQNRPLDSSLLSIEKQLLAKIQNQKTFYDDVIDDFTKKSRNIDLIFK